MKKQLCYSLLVVGLLGQAALKAEFDANFVMQEVASIKESGVNPNTIVELVAQLKEVKELGFDNMVATVTGGYEEFMIKVQPAYEKALADSEVARNTYLAKTKRAFSNVGSYFFGTVKGAAVTAGTVLALYKVGNPFKK